MVNKDFLQFYTDEQITYFSCIYLLLTILAKQKGMKYVEKNQQYLSLVF
jgi:hypothetical protein